MMPQGPPTPRGGSQPIPPSLLRSNSGLLGGQGSGMTSPNAFPSLVSPRNQFNNANMLGNSSNVSSLLHQSFNNGGPSPGLSGPGNSSRGLIDGNGMGFNTPSTSYVSSPIMADQNSSGQVQGKQQYSNPSGNLMLTDQQQAQQLDMSNFQHTRQQFSVPSSSQQQQQFQAMRPGVGGVGPVKMEPQTTSEQAPQQLQSLRNFSSVKLEPQQLQNIRGLGPVKMESQHSDPSLFLQQQQQQQQQQLLLSRQSPQSATPSQILHQQRLLHLQHQQQQQQQLLTSMPQQRSPLQPQLRPQSLPIRSPVKPVYEPGMCARRLTHYMYQQQHRPDDNSIDFWRKFVAEYFAPNAKKKWCVSMYGSGRQTTGVFPQDVWHCEICNRKPGRGFEASFEVLPRLFKMKYESGTLEELLYVDMPREYQNSSGQIVLDYGKAIQQSVFEQLRVVRDGQLRIVFSPDLKICSWEFCARRHEELIPRRSLIPQVSQIGAAAQKYQAAATQNASPSASSSELQNNCNMFVSSARQLAKALEVPLVNDLGYTKRYVRCLQISEVVNSMKDLIDFSRETNAGPMESLAKFPRKRKNPSPSSCPGRLQQPDGQFQQQQIMGQSANIDNSIPSAAMQLNSTTGTPNNNAMNSMPTSTSTIAGLLHQNSMNSRHQNPIPSANSPYSGGNSVQMPSSPIPPPSSIPSASNNLQPTSHGSLSGAHMNSSSPYAGISVQMPSPQSSNPIPLASSTPSASNNMPSTLPGAHMNSSNSPNISMPTISGDADGGDSQSSVQKIIQDMMSSQLNTGHGIMSMRTTMGADANNGSGGGNILVGTGVAKGNLNGMGIRAAAGNNSVLMNSRGQDRVMNPSHQPQHDMSNQLLGAVNGFNNFQFDWKTSP